MYRIVIILLFASLLSSCSTLSSDQAKLVDVYGTITLANDENNIPLNKALIIISDKWDSTDQNGKYRIDDLVEGEYIASILYNDSDTIKVQINVSVEQDSLEIPISIFPTKKGQDGIFGTIVYMNLPVPDVDIKIYDVINGTKILVRTGKTDLNGYFNVTELNDRLKEIHFSHGYLEEYIVDGYIKYMGNVGSADCFDTNLNGACIADLKVIEMYQNEIVWDYFPIGKDSSFSFNYQMGSNRANSYDAYSGEIEWTVTDVNIVSEKHIYSIREVFNGTYSITGPDCKGNDSFETKTIELKNDTLAFSIEINNDGEIDINYPFRELGCADLSYYYDTYANGTDLRRYYSPLIGENEFEFTNYGEALNTNAILIRDKGIKKLSISETPHNSGSYFIIEAK